MMAILHLGYVLARRRLMSFISHYIRQWLFTPKLDFSDLDALNAWLSLRCNELGIRAHPDQKDQTIDAIFAMEQAELRPIGMVLTDM